MPLVVQVDSGKASASLMPLFFIVVFQSLKLLNESQLGVIPRNSPLFGGAFVGGWERACPTIAGCQPHQIAGQARSHLLPPVHNGASMANPCKRRYWRKTFGT